MRRANITLAIALITCSLNAQSPIVLTADADAAIGYHDFYNTENTNYGDAIQNAAYIRPGNLGGLNVNRALIHFDLSVIPLNAVIASAKLNLFAMGPVGDLPGHFGSNNSAVLQRVTEDWAENTVTWNNQPATTSLNEVVLPASIDPLQDYIDIDVTDLIQDLQGTANFGFLLKQITENPTNALIFASLDYGDENKFPTLEITLADNCINVVTNTDAAIGYHDNYNTSDNNYGTAIQNAAYALLGNLGGLNANRALVYFDLSGIPPGAMITSATLNLFAIGPLGDLSGHTGPDNRAVLQRVTESWAEDVVTWDLQPNSSEQNEVMLPASLDPLQDYTDIDVIDLVTDMIETENFGFLLKLLDENPENALLFYSSDNPDSLKHPLLEICYSVSTNIADHHEKADLFNVFPNPASGYVTATFSGFSNAEESSVDIYSIAGEFIKSVNVDNETIGIDLHNLLPGVYLFKLVSNIPTSPIKVVLSMEK